MAEFMNAVVFILTLLNPFLMIVYLTDVVKKLSYPAFASTLIKAGLISGAVFCLFGILGDAIFSSVIQAEFASFQIFGGIVFLLISIKFVFQGTEAIELLRGDAPNLAGAIAMPVFIGPGTISASVVAGKRLNAMGAIAAIMTALVISVGAILLLKQLHDRIKPRHARLIDLYVDIAGRVTALYVGTISIEMIMRGLQIWISKLAPSL
jgi:multiple antibiotic resistance protein